MLHRLSVEDAARRLGLSQQTVKRRLKKGTLRGEQEPTPTGFRWYVIVDAAATPGTAADTPAGTSAGIPGTSGDTPADTAHTPSPALVAARRAEEMAVYSERLLRPVLARLEEQAAEIGRLTERTVTLQAETEQLRARVAELEAPPETQHGAASEEPERRRWWQRLLWG